MHAHQMQANSRVLALALSTVPLHCAEYEVQLALLRQREIARFAGSCPPLPVDMDDVSH